MRIGARLVGNATTWVVTHVFVFEAYLALVYKMSFMKLCELLYMCKVLDPGFGQSSIAGFVSSVVRSTASVVKIRY